MQSLTVVCLLAFAAVAFARPEQYTDRYDTVNLDEILSNRRLLVPYLKCVLGEGKCSPDGKELRSHIKEALENYCAKCTETQKNGTRRVIGHLINNEPQYWQQLCDKYDPQKKYVAKYEDELRVVAGKAYAKCTATQKNGTCRVIGHMINNEPQYWQQLCDKYDPQKKYVAKYEDELRVVAGKA